MIKNKGKSKGFSVPWMSEARHTRNGVAHELPLVFRKAIALNMLHERHPKVV